MQQTNSQTNASAAATAQFDYEAWMNDCREQSKVGHAKANKLSIVVRRAVKNGFQFIGEIDGEVIVIRACATQPYTYAAIHTGRNVTKFEREDPRSHITLHSVRPKSASKGDSITKILQITESN